MNISILSVFPNLYEQFLKTSLIARAQESQKVAIDCVSFFSYVNPKSRIDAPTYGPGTGMLIRPDIMEKAIEHQEQLKGKAFKIFFSPQGEKLNQNLLKKLATQVQERNHLMMVATRYEGTDARVQEYYADAVLSVGDFVLMGGDLPAMMTLEGLLRLIPDIVGKKESVEHESFMGPFVDYPEFTEPATWKGIDVPNIVRSGNHAAIETWRRKQAAELTILKHFDWLRAYQLSKEQKLYVSNFIPSHYAALMHTGVLLPDNVEGTTSITSLDIHDGARSAKTYGLKGYFLVTPLTDQQKIAQTLLNFWKQGIGKEYNPSRHEAVNLAEISTSLDEVIQAIESREGKAPLIVATSAHTSLPNKTINFFQQSLVWQQNRPILFLFGTGKGLAPSLLKRADYILCPLEGFTDFNHLSVRSAMAVIFDRWLGINPTG